MRLPLNVDLELSHQMILRRLKRTISPGEGPENYFRHAFGEIALLVIGILIALQIDSWNTEREQQRTLTRYLNNIAGNVNSDLVALEILRTRREATYELVTFALQSISDKSEFSVDEVSLGNQVLARAQELLHFNAKTSGYESLQRSGVFDHLQGRDIESLLNDYYDTVSRITYAERHHNEYMQQIGLQIILNWPKDLSMWHIQDPGGLADDRFKALQPGYVDLFNTPSFKSLFDRVLATDRLLADYERLNKLGGAVVRMVENRLLEFDQATIDTLSRIHDPDRRIGYPEIITNGRVSWMAYNLIAGDSFQTDLRGRSLEQIEQAGNQRIFHHGTLTRSDDSLIIHYQGGAEWAGVWIHVKGLVENGIRPNGDFSEFETLQLEIKGELGGETILLNMEDGEDSQDGTTTRYPLQITDQWQTYEIDLAEFKTANLSKLWTPLGFVFPGPKAQTVSVRNARYLRKN